MLLVERGALKILEQKDEMDPAWLLLLAVRFLVKHYIRGNLFNKHSYSDIQGYIMGSYYLFKLNNLV